LTILQGSTYHTCRGHRGTTTCRPLRCTCLRCGSDATRYVGKAGSNDPRATRSCHHTATRRSCRTPGCFHCGSPWLSTRSSSCNHKYRDDATSWCTTRNYQLLPPHAAPPRRSNGDELNSPTWLSRCTAPSSTCTNAHCKHLTIRRGNTSHTCIPLRNGTRSLRRSPRKSRGPCKSKDYPVCIFCSNQFHVPHPHHIATSPQCRRTSPCGCNRPRNNPCRH